MQGCAAADGASPRAPRRRPSPPHTHPPGAALLEFAAGLSDPHDALALWAAGSHPCGGAAGAARPWPGVACDAPAGSVVGLGLAGRGLGGRLGPSLAGIGTLRSMCGRTLR
jgi:hypothetical protein